MILRFIFFRTNEPFFLVLETCCISLFTCLKLSAIDFSAVCGTFFKLVKDLLAELVRFAFADLSDVAGGIFFVWLA